MNTISNRKLNNRETQSCLDIFFIKKKLVSNELAPENSPIKAPIYKGFTI
jgi:hypothetical protein